MRKRWQTLASCNSTSQHLDQSNVDDECLLYIIEQSHEATVRQCCTEHMKQLFKGRPR